MDVNNNIANLNLKVKCDLCEKSFFGEFLSKHMWISHLVVERPNQKKTQHFLVTKVPDLIISSGIWLKMMVANSFVNFVMKSLK